MSESKARSSLWANIKKLITTSTTTVVVAAASMPSTTKSAPIYDGNGNILGYVALYANANLT